MNNTVPVLFHIFHVFFSYCNICHRNKRYCDVIQNVFIEGIWINLEGRIIASCFDLLDGEGHVRCESWPHPDPRAHPHHDRPGELLLPGGCLQCLAVSGEHPNRFQICEQQAPKFKKKNVCFAFSGGWLHPFRSSQHDDGWRGLLFCRRTRQRHVHPPVPERAQQVNVSQTLIQHHFSWKKVSNLTPFKWLFCWLPYGLL